MAKKPNNLTGQSEGKTSRGLLNWLRRKRSILALTLAGILLLLAQSAAWVNHIVFDKQTFTTITSGVIHSEESRHAIASGIVNRALEDRPVLQRTISDKATQLVTGLLSTDIVTQATNTFIDRAYGYATSKDPQPIAFDLTGIKTPIARIVALAEDQGREVSFDPNKIPDTIELFNPDQLPNIYGFSIMMMILGPVFWLSVAAIFGYYIYRGGKAFYAKRVYIVGSVIIITSLLGLLIGPLLPPPVGALVSPANLRGIVQDLVSAFLEPFTRQLILTILLTLLVLLVFSQRYTLTRFVRRADAGQLTGKKRPTK